MPDLPGRIRVGIGGWSYEPWRKTFYPPEVPKKLELQYASRRLTAIEINSTFYRLQTPAVFAKWRDQTPDSFVFSIKAPRYIVGRKLLAESGEAIARFIGSGPAALGAKLGPILWQLAPAKRFEPEDLEGFLQLLPKHSAGLPLRHALEVRHESFLHADFLALARRHQVATVFADSDRYPRCADLTADFVYARLMRCTASVATGYPPRALAAWAKRAQAWAQGGQPDDLPRVEKNVSAATPRDVFVFVINGAKERAPAAAGHLLSRLDDAPAKPTRKRR
jgi:uncharacterized protein YecE (DUF72 family)